MRPAPRSHGSGEFVRASLGLCPDSVMIESGVLIFHPENVFLEERVYVGHRAILKGYYKNELRVGSGTWIGQEVFFHSAGGIEIGQDVGIGPRVMILTSAHELPAQPDGSPEPILHRPIGFAKVTLEDGCDIGVGAILLPGYDWQGCAGRSGCGGDSLCGGANHRRWQSGASDSCVLIDSGCVQRLSPEPSLAADFPLQSERLAYLGRDTSWDLEHLERPRS